MTIERTITIERSSEHGWIVREGGRYAAYLAWDEMLGQIAAMTHHAIGRGHYPMLTATEHREHDGARVARVAAIRAEADARAEQLLRSEATRAALLNLIDASELLITKPTPINEGF